MKTIGRQITACALAAGLAAPGDLRKYYREQVQALVYGAMTR